MVRKSQIRKMPHFSENLRNCDLRNIFAERPLLSSGFYMAMLDGIKFIIAVRELETEGKLSLVSRFTLMTFVKVGPPVHNYEHEAGSYGDGFT